MKAKAIFLCLILLCGAGLLLSQNRAFAPENISCTSSVTCSVEDADYLYLGTPGGLLRIDKDNQERNLFHVANSLLGSNEITALAFGSNNVLWVGTSRAGLYSWDGTVWKAHNDYLFNRGIKFIPRICVDGNGYVWIASRDEQNPVLLKYTPSGWTEYNPGNSELPAQSIVDMAIGINGSIWILSFDSFEYFTPGVGWEAWASGYLVKVNSSGMLIHNLCDGMPQLDSNNTCFNLEVDSAGRPWLLTQEYGGTLWILDEYTWSSMRLSTVLATNFYATGIAIGENNTVWLSSQAQLAKLNSNLVPTLYPVTSTLFSPLALLSVYQNSLIFDVERPYNSIPGYLRFEDGVWTDCSSATNPLDYVSSSFVEDYAVDAAGNLWVSGSHLQGLFRWDGQNWTPFSTNPITSIYADPTGGIWLGTLGHLTRVVGDSWTTYDCEASGLWHPQKMVRGPDNMLHVIDNSSIYTWDITNHTGHVYLSVDNHLLPSHYLQDIAVDQYNRKWIATSNGLVQWLGYDVAIFTTANTPFNSNNFTALQRDGDYLWIGTRTGQLARLFVNEFQMQNLSVFGDPPEAIADLAVDGDHSIWLTSEYGPLYHWVNGELHSTDTAGNALTLSESSQILIGPDGKKWLNMARNGIICFSGEIVANVDPGEDASPVSILSNFPNPFTSGTTFSFRAPETGSYTLEIFNLRGQLVLSTPIKSTAKAQVDWLWDGTNKRGERLAGGVYFARLSWPKGSCSRKLLLVK